MSFILIFQPHLKTLFHTFMSKSTTLFSSKKYKFDLARLCSPAAFYFYLSFITIIIAGVFNLDGTGNTLCLGKIRCDVGEKSFVFLMYAVYILFWTFVLDLMCKNQFTTFSWLLVLLPLVLPMIYVFMLVFMYA